MTEYAGPLPTNVIYHRKTPTGKDKAEWTYLISSQLHSRRFRVFVSDKVKTLNNW